MSTRATEICASVSAGSQNSFMGPEAVKSAVLHVKCNDTDTFAALHDQVECEELNEKVGVVAQRLAIECVKESMTCTVGGGGATIRLSTLSVLE